MTDAAFSKGLRDAFEESLDDLAHFRPDRHASAFGYRRGGRMAIGPEDVEPPIVVRRFPEDGCPPFCTDCLVRFRDGQIFHPEMDGTRCIPCFKFH